MIKKIQPHMAIIMSVIMITLIVLNNINDAMGFLRGRSFETLLIIYSMVTLASSITMVSVLRSKGINLK